jgi:hypothetical protein
VDDGATRTGWVQPGRAVGIRQVDIVESAEARQILEDVTIDAAEVIGVKVAGNGISIELRDSPERELRFKPFPFEGPRFIAAGPAHGPLSGSQRFPLPSDIAARKCLIFRTDLEAFQTHRSAREVYRALAPATFFRGQQLFVPIHSLALLRLIDVKAHQLGQDLCSRPVRTFNGLGETRPQFGFDAEDHLNFFGH